MLWGKCVFLCCYFRDTPFLKKIIRYTTYFVRQSVIHSVLLHKTFLYLYAKVLWFISPIISPFVHLWYLYFSSYCYDYNLIKNNKLFNTLNTFRRSRSVRWYSWHLYNLYTHLYRLYTPHVYTLTVQISGKDIVYLSCPSDPIFRQN